MQGRNRDAGIENRLVDPAGRGDGGKIERVVLRHTRYHIKKIVSERMLCNTGSSP